MAESKWDPDKQRWIVTCYRCGMFGKHLGRFKSRGKALSKAIRHDEKKHPAR